MKSHATVILLMFITPFWVHGEEPGSLDLIQVCYNYSCKDQAQVELIGPEWNEIAELFNSQSNSPLEERKKISKAIALMETLTGKRLGTSNDKAENNGTGEPGQMDCIDESRNSTSYLKLFDNKGWIKWHQVQDRTVRSPYFFTAHWTAVIKENMSGQLYAVDSWFRDNGKEPVILTLDDWMAKKENP